MLAFTAPVDGHQVLATVDTSGAHQKVLLPSGFYGGDAAFSPDGKRLLFDSDHASTTGPTGTGFHIDLFVVPVAGGTPTALTRHGISQKGAWSADGALIAFERQDKDDAPDHISVMKADGTDVRDVTTNPFGNTDEDPSFSPDGTRIAFQRHRSASESAVFVVTVASGKVAQLTDWVSQAGQMSWSPSGELILFNTGSDTPQSVAPEITTIHPDGTGLSTLAAGYQPAWSPDGSWIVFVRGGQLWTMRADGSAERVVTGASGQDPTWG